MSSYLAKGSRDLSPLNNVVLAPLMLNPREDIPYDRLPSPTCGTSQCLTSSPVIGTAEFAMGFGRQLLVYDRSMLGRSMRSGDGAVPTH